MGAACYASVVGGGLGWGWPGVTERKSRVQDARLATHATETFLGVPRALALLGRLVVGDQLAVDDV